MNEATNVHVNEALFRINGKGPSLKIKPRKTYTIMNPENKKTCVVAGIDLQLYLQRDPPWTVVEDVVPEVAKPEEPETSTEDTGEEDTGEEEDEDVTITKDDIKKMDQSQLRQLLADAEKVISLDGLNLKKARNAVIQALGLE